MLQLKSSLGMVL